MKSKKRQLRPKSLIFVKLESLDDLSRYVCNYDYTNAQLVSFKSGGAYRIFALGEEIGKSTIAYYVSNPKSEHAIGYTYHVKSAKDRLPLVDKRVYLRYGLCA